MKKINWGQKLTSRKFWAAVVGFVTALLLAFGVSDSETTQVGERIVDASRALDEGEANHDA